MYFFFLRLEFDAMKFLDVQRSIQRYMAVTGDLGCAGSNPEICIGLRARYVVCCGTRMTVLT